MNGFFNVYMKRLRRHLFISLCIVLFNVFSYSFVLASEPLIGEDDSYEKNILIDSSDQFNWTVYKNSSINYVVRVHASGLEVWDQKITPDYFVLDETNPYQIVGLKVHIPSFPNVDRRNATIFFTFRPINLTDTFIIKKEVIVNVKGEGFSAPSQFILGQFENPFPTPLNTPFGTFFVNVFLWALIAFIVYFFIKRILIQIAKKTQTLFDDILIEIIRRPILLLIILYGGVQSLFELNISVGLRVTIDQITHILFFIIIIYMAYRIFNEILEEITIRKGGKNTMFGAVLKPVLRKIGISIIIIGGFIYILSSLGIQITAILAGAGVLGLVIAFAAQDTLSNFFSGIHLLLDRPFKIGDVIFLETGEYCRVENVGMRSTKLYSILEHQVIILPNNALANQKIINIVRPDARILKNIKVGVAYGSDIELVKKILYETAKKHPHVVQDKGYEPKVRFIGFGDSSLDFIVYIWIDEVMNQWRVLSDIRTEINDQFRKKGITIPFPQRTVWLHHEDINNDKKL
jgi:small-conductance mechanosensitive channel